MGLFCVPNTGRRTGGRSETDHWRTGLEAEPSNSDNPAGGRRPKGETNRLAEWEMNGKREERSAMTRQRPAPDLRAGEPLPWSEAAAEQLFLLIRRTGWGLTLFLAKAHNSPTGQELAGSNKPLGRKMLGYYLDGSHGPPAYRIKQFFEVFEKEKRCPWKSWADMYVEMYPDALRDQDLVKRYGLTVATPPPGARAAERGVASPTSRPAATRVASPVFDTPDQTLDTFADRGRASLSGVIAASEKACILFASIGGGGQASGRIGHLFLGSEFRAEPPQISKVVVKRLHPTVIQAQIDAGKLPANFATRISISMNDMERVLTDYGVDLEVRFWDTFPPPFHGYLYDAHLFRGKWAPGTDGHWHVRTQKRHFTDETDPEVLTRARADFDSPSTLPHPSALLQSKPLAELPGGVVPGKLLEHEERIALLNQLVCHAPESAVLYGSVGGAGTAYSWLSHVFEGSEYRPQRQPKISKIVIKRLHPDVVRQQVEQGRLPPGFEARLSLNLQAIASKVQSRNVELEVQYWPACPPPFYGWIFSNHLLTASWNHGTGGYWHVHTPMRYIPRDMDEATFDAFAAMFGSPGEDLATSRDLVESLQSLTDSGVRHVATSFPDDINWDQAFGHARNIDLITITSLAWRKKNVLRLRAAFGDPSVAIRIVLPDVADDTVIEMIARQRVWSSAKVREFILDTERFYRRLIVKDGATVKFFWMKVSQKYAVYRFDGVIVLKFYGHNRNEQPGPGLVAKDGGLLFPHLLRDIDGIFANHVREVAQGAESDSAGGVVESTQSPERILDKVSPPDLWTVRPGQLLGHEAYTTFLSFLVTSATHAPEPIFGSLGGGGFTATWLGRLFAGVDYQVNPPKISKVVLKRLTAISIQRGVESGDLEPDHETLLDANLRKITRILDAQGIPLEVRFWDSFPPPYHGWRYANHLLSARWSQSAGGLRSDVQNPLRYVTRESNPDRFAEAVRLFDGDE